MSTVAVNPALAARTAVNALRMARRPAFDPSAEQYAARVAESRREAEAAAVRDALARYGYATAFAVDSFPTPVEWSWCVLVDVGHANRDPAGPNRYTVIVDRGVVTEEYDGGDWRRAKRAFGGDVEWVSR